MGKKLLIRAAACLSFCLLLTGAGYGQQMTIRGAVYSMADGRPVATAVAICDNQPAHTDSTGGFRLTIDLPLPAVIKLRHASYAAEHVVVKSAADSVITVYMQPVAVDLQEIEVHTRKDNSFGISRLRNVEGTTIYAGKKSEAIYLDDINANLAANNSRQIYSRIPGINIFENDGSGNSVGIGGRGLNPNRISNFNTRQNGYDISADALGYPESYYTPPSEAVERIEILRGAAGLQFGTQFGGMINYRMASASEKKLSGNFRQTAGSFGFFNSFNQISGTSGKWTYNSFYQYKSYKGWRERSEMASHNAYLSLGYRFSERLSIQCDYTFMRSLAQQPGGLTDKQFYADPSLVTRYRNWFRVDWNLLAVTADYRLSPSTRMNLRTFGLAAGREALGVLGRTERADDTSAFRNLLSDRYRNYGAELRFLHRYRFLGNASNFLVGARVYRGHTLREQGDASKSAAPDFRFIHDEPNNSSYTFPSRNEAVFTENVFQLGNRWSITPGIRVEHIVTSSDGHYHLTNLNLAGDTLWHSKMNDQRSSERSLALFGIGAQYKLNKNIEAYANISQNYRSINFNDMRVVNPNFQVDPMLRDERGFTADIGLRGAIRDVLYFDANLYLLQYNDRIGTTLKEDEQTFQLIRYRTNISDSRSAGIEAMAEVDWLKVADASAKQKFSTFVNLSTIDARYISPLKIYNNKRVEYVPGMIVRTGATYALRKLSITVQYSYTGEQFSDATNAEYSPGAIYGTIPAYSVVDCSAGYTWKMLSVYAGVNNFLNSSYFTRRAEGYPGPGIIPADPRNCYLTLRLRI